MIVESEKNSINNELHRLVDYYEKHKKLEKKIKEESDEDTPTKIPQSVRKKDTPTKISQSVRKKTHQLKYLKV